MTNVTSKGYGAIIKNEDEIKLHFLAFDSERKVVLSSYHEQSPWVIKLGDQGLIICWNLALVGMNKGTKFELTCPPHLAYGADKVGEILAAGQELFFEMHLLEEAEAGPKFTGAFDILYQFVQAPAKVTKEL